MLKLDLKDRRILHELDHNARIPFSRLGKKIGLSESVVRYRVERLLSSGVLRGFVAFVDTYELGFRHYNVFLKLKVISEKKEADIFEGLKRLPSVCWLVSTSGQYNLVAGVLAKDVEEFEDAFNSMMRVLENCVDEDSVLIASGAFQFSYPLLEKRQEIKPAVLNAGQKVKLSRVDFGILQELSKDPRISVLDISKKLNLSFSIVSRHFSSLLSSGYIQGFKPWINMEKLGKYYYIVLLKLKYVDRRTRNSFIEGLKQLPQTYFITNGVGNWSVQVEFFCSDDSEFRKVMNKIFPSQKSDIVKEHTELRVNDELKCVFYPIGLSAGAMQTSLSSWYEQKNINKRKK
ncbi:Lrp/AsnC family transcriptional regulator [Candidatus Woesearchaeota archaeon]|nr:Lrp/AsnC family transcriptional regulator [Candidatus Woesearchaeota archaeon]